jgi:hypothetical protein
VNVQHRQDCESNIRRIEELFGSGIFNSNNVRHPLQRSAFIDLMICMRDLMHKTEKYAKRIAFTDDILTSNYVADVTDAITAVRDACCHIDSFKKLFDDRGNRGTYMVAYGKCNLAKIDDLELRSEYEDDCAVFYGKNRLYLKRHLLRALSESKALLAPMLSEWRA